MKQTKFYLALITGFLLGAATIGCHSSSSAADDDSGYATASSVASLQAQVNSLAAQVPHLVITAVVHMTPAEAQREKISRPQLVGDTISAPTAVTVTQAVGTSVGPVSGNAGTTPAVWMNSDTGYMFILPLSSDSTVGIFSPYPISFDDSTCGASGGSAYIQSSTDVSVFTLEKGVVLSPSGGAAVDYLYAPKNSANTDFTELSELVGPNNCQSVPATAANQIKLLPNDPNITHVPNGTVSSPSF